MSTVTDTINARVETRLAELTTQRAARKHLDELLRSMPQHEAYAYDAETAEIDALIVAIGKAASACSSMLSTLDVDVAWLPHLKVWREALSADLLAMHPRIRNEKELNQKLALEWSIRLIDHGFIAMALPIVTLQPTRVGQLMHAAGYDVHDDGLHGLHGWRGSLPEVEARIKTVTAEREKLMAKLDALLLPDAERAKQEAEKEAHRAAVATMNVQLNTEGSGLSAFTKDGDPLPISDMTSEQRAAFEWFAAVACR